MFFFFTGWTSQSGELALAAGTGVFVESGSSAGLIVSRKIVVSQATFSETGQSAVLLHGFVLNSATGNFATTYNDASLVYQSNQNLVLEAAKGIFTVTAQASSLSVSRKIIANTGNLSLVGNDADLRNSRKIISENSNFTLNVNSANLLVTRSLISNSGNFLLGLNTANLLNSRKFSGLAGTVVLNFSPAELKSSRILLTQVEIFNLSGIDSQFNIARKIAATVGNINFNGSVDLLQIARLIQLTAGNFNLIGLNSELVKTARFSLIKLAAQFEAVYIQQINTSFVTYQPFSADLENQNGSQIS
jgi:hypothetical protein